MTDKKGYFKLIYTIKDTGLLKYLNEILLLGTNPTYIEHLNLRIRTVNMVALIVIIVASSHIGYDLIIGAWLTAMANFAYVLIPLIILYFNWKKDYRKAFYVTAIGFPMVIFGTSLVIGSNCNSEFFLIVTGCSSPLLFRDRKIKNIFFLLNLGLYCGLLIFYEYYPNGLESQIFSPLVEPVNGIVIFSLLFILFNSIFSSNVHYQELILEKNELINQLNKTLEEKVERRTAEIKAQAKALQQSSEEINRLAYIAFHDLREPLRNISGFAKLIERNVAQQNFDNLKEYTQYITWGVNRMDRITKDIAIYAEIGQTQLEVKPVQLNLLLAQIIEKLSPFIEQESPLITIKELPTINCNITQVQLLFENLIKNAVLYRRETPPCIDIQAIDKGQFWQFQVQDNGIGIASEYQEGIFTMFTRLHNDVQQVGSGIGLALCKKIVGNHKGKIWIESKLQEGTIVKFTLAKIELRK